MYNPEKIILTRDQVRFAIQEYLNAKVFKSPVSVESFTMSENGSGYSRSFECSVVIVDQPPASEEVSSGS